MAPAFRHVRLVVAVGICSAVTAALMVPPALADDLSDQRDQVKAQQAAKKRES